MPMMALRKERHPEEPAQLASRRTERRDIGQTRRAIRVGGGCVGADAVEDALRGATDNVGKT